MSESNLKYSLVKYEVVKPDIGLSHTVPSLVTKNRGKETQQRVKICSCEIWFEFFLEEQKNYN